jgi:hypothetical protein
MVAFIGPGNPTVGVGYGIREFMSSALV